MLINSLFLYAVAIAHWASYILETWYKRKEIEAWTKTDMFEKNVKVVWVLKW